jgi:hypothetical protein
MHDRSSIIRCMAMMCAVVALWSQPAAAATGRGKTIVPPGNSGASQYVEVVPTGGGNRPTSSIRPSSPSAAHPTSGSSSTGATPSASSIPAPVQRAFHRSGTTGADALALAKATAPPAPAMPQPQRPASQNAGGGSSPLVSVLKAATGGSSSGAGLGASLPVIFILIAIGGLAYSLRRRRTA